MLFRLVSIFLFGFIIQYAFKTLLVLGVHKRVYNHRPGECRRVQGISVGSEDVSLVPEKNLAFISSGVVYIPKNSSINFNGQIFVYDVKKRDYEAIPVPIKGLDNSACHPILMDAAKHFGDTSNPNLTAPSQVLRFSFSKDYKSSKIVEVFMDDGNFISASSVAVNFDNSRQLLIGSVGRELVHCDINIPLDF
ncbi:unnamed protein product [Caenorhabditis bovis]|uniref:Uncharacterized protein n=1 Tax=Caenorhabditis bovis TaxID=2654633 RepID=A0A8S1F0V8_9PELO|nr:unnamed protein product [Caenorhabditis bovis]